MLFDLSVIQNHKNEIISALIGLMCTSYVLFCLGLTFVVINPPLHSFFYHALFNYGDISIV